MGEENCPKQCDKSPFFKGIADIIFALSIKTNSKKENYDNSI